MKQCGKKMQAGVFLGIILLLVVCGVALLGSSPKPARFALGKTVMIKTFNVDGRGINLQIADSGSPLDGLTLTIPPGALKSEGGSVPQILDSLSSWYNG